MYLRDLLFWNFKRTLHSKQIIWDSEESTKYFEIIGFPNSFRIGKHTSNSELEFWKANCNRNECCHKLQSNCVDKSERKTFTQILREGLLE